MRTTPTYHGLTAHCKLKPTERFSIESVGKRSYRWIDLISPTYVMIGASIKPTPRPSNTLAVNTSAIDVALYIIIQAITCGMFTRNIARFLPNGSDIHPDKMLPTGWQMKAMLPNHDASDGDSFKYSLALGPFACPVNAGITMVGYATDTPKSSSRKFFTVLARIWENKNCESIRLNEQHTGYLLVVKRDGTCWLRPGRRILASASSS